jgi:hypothetical protein
VSDNLTGQDAQDAQNAQDAVCDRCGGPAGGEGKTIMVVTRKATHTLAICRGCREYTERMEQNGHVLALRREIRRIALKHPERAEPLRTPAERLGRMLGIRIPENPQHRERAAGMRPSVTPAGRPAWQRLAAWPQKTADRQKEKEK